MATVQRATGVWRMPVLLAALVIATALAACGDAHETGADPSPAPQARAGRHGDARPAAPACGWIPAGAREATPVISLQAGSAGDPLCASTGSALDVPKVLVASIDRELREASRMSDEDEDRIGAQ